MTTVRLLAPLFTALLVACAPSVPRVSMADRDPLRRVVVADVADGLVDTFPPTATPLSPARDFTGPFDSALLATLRERGYAFAPAGGHGTPFDVLVEPLEGTIYRVTVRLGVAVLSRLWVLDGANAYNGGAWARRQ